MPDCTHQNFSANVSVNRLREGEGTPVHSFLADVQVWCVECKTPFRFLGLSSGIDLRGARVSVTGEEAHLALAPKGVQLPPPPNVRSINMPRLDT